MVKGKMEWAFYNNDMSIHEILARKKLKEVDYEIV